MFVPIVLSIALFHDETGTAAGVLAGLKHPVSGLDHVLAMVAVGLWGAQLGKPAVWVLPVAFPMVMALGGMLGLLGMPLPAVEVGIALSALALGAMVLFECRLGLPVAAILVGAFAVFHGHAHGTELPKGTTAIAYSAGFVVATGCLHGVGICLGLVHRWDWGQRVLRAAGAIVALGGAYYLWNGVS